MRSSRPASDGASYRPYLDGLRAIAVLAVLVYHLDRAWLPGGYLGVDVFFVLSGYLITMLLLAEHEKTGRIHLPSFWARRLRRLLPALLLLLVVMAVLIAIGGDLLAQGQARGDLLATLFYVANWRFIAEGQSYFSQYVAVSPDRHTWSLAIEEQFYLVWPVVVALVLPRLRKTGLALLAAGIAVFSAVLMFALFDPIDPSRAYYGTDSRIFEILIGALLAVALSGSLRDRIGRAGRILAPLALVLLCGAFALLADNNAFYYRGGAVLLAIAVATLIAGLETGSRLHRALSLRPLVLVGIVSYGLYLWHFPIITFIDQRIGPTSLPGLALLATGLTFAVTAVSYVAVERPIRRGGALGGLRLTPSVLARVVPLASGTVAVAILVSTASGIDAPGWDASNFPPAGAAGVPGIAVPQVAVGTDPSVVVSEAPVATPGPGFTLVPVQTPAGAVAGRVAPGSAGWTVGVVGDSVMESAVPGLQPAAAARGWRLVNAARPACPVGYEPLYDEAGNPSPYNAQCRAGVQPAHDALIAAGPDVVVWHDLQSSLARRSPNGTLFAPGSDAWTADLIAEWDVVLDRFLAVGAQVVIVLPPERSQQAAGCRGAPLMDRCLTIQHQDTVIRAATRRFFASLGGRSDVHLIELDSLLCPNGYPCPGQIEGRAVRLTGFDQTHFSPDGARWLAPRLLDRVLAAVGGPTG